MSKINYPLLVFFAAILFMIVHSFVANLNPVYIDPDQFQTSKIGKSLDEKCEKGDTVACATLEQGGQ